MVVLVIIGGLLSLVNLNASDTQIQDETGRFATTLVIEMNLYREEADNGPLPALQFLSSEEYTAFDLTIGHDADSRFAFVIHGDGFNPVWKELVRYEH